MKEWKQEIVDKLTEVAKAKTTVMSTKTQQRLWVIHTFVDRM